MLRECVESAGRFATRFRTRPSRMLDNMYDFYLPRLMNNDFCCSPGPPILDANVFLCSSGTLCTCLARHNFRYPPSTSLMPGWLVMVGRSPLLPRLTAKASNFSTGCITLVHVYSISLTADGLYSMPVPFYGIFPL
jgi:hypothetical protein